MNARSIFGRVFFLISWCYLIIDIPASLVRDDRKKKFKMIEIDPKNVFIIPKFWGGVISSLLTLIIGVIGYVYVYQISELKNDLKIMQQQIRDAEIRQLSTIDVISELHHDKDVLIMIDRHRLKYYHYNVRGQK